MTRAFFFALALIFALSSQAKAPESNSAQPPADEIREAMREIFAHLQTVLAEIAAQQTPSSSANGTPPSRRANDVTRARTALREIDDLAALLSGHASADDELTGFLAASLAQMASVTAFQYDTSPPDVWRRQVYRMIDLCVACHTRHAPSRSPQGRDFIDRSSLLAVPLASQAEVLTATRRFRPAFDKWREAINAQLARRSTPPPGQVAESQARELFSALSSALVIAIRVLGDFEAARDLLTSVRDNPRRPGYFDKTFDDFLRSFPSIRASLNRVLPDTIAAVEALVSAGKARGEAAPQGGMLHDIAAATILYRELDNGKLRGEERARALYLLAGSEHRLQAIKLRPGERSWLPHAELLLELAIIESPHSVTAHDAYRQLELLVREAFSGPLPDEVTSHLRRLQRLSTAPPVAR